MYRSRAHYWSNSKFADWVRDTFADYKKLGVVTMEEWDEYHDANKTNSPFVYWFTEDFLTLLQDVLMFPSDVVDEVRHYWVNRFVTKTHMINTKLKPGQWHETDTRMMHGMFQLLVDFVEIEKAQMNAWCSPKEVDRPWWYRFRVFRWSDYRSRKDGIAYLDWEITLDAPNVDEYGTDHSCPAQAASAAETKKLYLWWTEQRPARPDPFDASGYTASLNELEIKYPDSKGRMFFGKYSEEDDKKLLNTMTEADNTTQRYEDEDMEMMIRLVKIKSSLWT